MKDWKTQVIQPEYLGLSDPLVPWSAKLWKWIVRVRKPLFATLCFIQQVLLKVFQKLFLVFPSLTQKQGAPNQNAGPKGCLQYRGICQAHEGNSFLSIICWWMKVSFAGKAPSWHWWEHHTEWLHSCWAALELSSSNRASMFSDTWHNLWIMNRARSLMISRCDLTWIKPSKYCT